MHSDAAPHLHSDECNVLASLYLQCMDEKYFGKYLGFCDNEHMKMVKCFKKERRARAELNHIKSRERIAEGKRRIAAELAKTAAEKKQEQHNESSSGK